MGLIERRIAQTPENYTFCLDLTTQDRIEAVRWSDDQTQLMVTLNRNGESEDRTFNLIPNP